jgi:hypothetical protein
VAGEDPHEALFDAVLGARKGFETIGHDPALTELLAVARILHVLGYVAPDTVRSPLFAELEWTAAVQEQAAKDKEWLRKAVNNAITEAQL